MNENINLCEILKDCQEGTKFYSPIYNKVSFFRLSEDSEQVIVMSTTNGHYFYIEKDGHAIIDATRTAEIMLLPSKDQRDWSKWKCPKPKFDPKTLQPFDKVLCRIDYDEKWGCEFYSHMHTPMEEVDYPFTCITTTYMHVIPYNDDTKHLVGTQEEAPEYYRYWEG